MSPGRRAGLLALLQRNEAAEDFHARMLRVYHDGTDLNRTVDEVLDIRDERVGILRQLGWHEEAGKLADDTAMRRKWTARR
jgi:hypothetical protein